MSHYDHIAEPPRPSRAGLIRAWAIGLALAVAGGLSLAYLVAEYRAAEPWRDARAAEYAREREARRKAEDARLPVAVPDAPANPARAADVPIVWTAHPRWPALTSEDLPDGVDVAGARFNCTVDAEGALSDCTGTDLPEGTGLAERLLPALEQARMKPLLMGGRPLHSKVSFTVQFAARPDPAPAATPEPEPEPEPAPGG